MIKPRLFVCNGVRPSTEAQKLKDCYQVKLDSIGYDANVNIQVKDVAKVFAKNISPRMLDLLEIAAYVYSADCATERGQHWIDDYSTEPWDRDFYFLIPVRDLAFWSKDEVQKLLIQALGFLSNDKYTFEFHPLEKDRPQQQYFEFNGEEDWPFLGVDRVLMFSGGLDSLAGAIETASKGENLVLVSHRPLPWISTRQTDLFAKLKAKYPSVKMLHVPIWINKDHGLGVEHTQRTRSFLFAALGTVVAESIKAGGVRFFENGIVSLNLPIADEALRARASRTTHPRSLYLFTQFLRLVTDRNFEVDNPFLFKTKADIVSLIAQKGGADLIPYTSSCAHIGFFKSKSQWHCGTCSQCIDRRVAMVAAGLEDYDSEADYVSDVFTGPRKEGYERNLAVNFARHVVELSSMSLEEMGTKFNLELTRAVRFLPKPAEMAQELLEMHKRYGEYAFGVLEQQVQQYARKLIQGQLDETSMLAMLSRNLHLEPTWKRFGDRIIQLLSDGVPRACATNKPENEKRLQEICDGIIKPWSKELIREFPFMRWSLSMTKPDWSNESLNLWVEIKYVRKKEDILQITEAIAADITKYGDNNRRVLFIVYDPAHLINDEEAFSEPIIKRENMRLHFLR